MTYPKDMSMKTQFPIIDTKQMHALMECMCICKACSKKCMDEDHKHLALICIDCSEICNLAIKLKTCESDYSHQALDLCAQACRYCANECNRVQSQHCQECAESCRRAAEACYAFIPTYH